MKQSVLFETVGKAALWKFVISLPAGTALHFSSPFSFRTEVPDKDFPHGPVSAVSSYPTNILRNASYGKSQSSRHFCITIASL